ncbi:MAG: DUF1501 domain-containing protein, partial [Planctomycetes bacterium]|nr:DUF1501 domain-containing protein [Planctomycetota bacterium]
MNSFLSTASHRRRFLEESACGLGSIALSHLMTLDKKTLAADTASTGNRAPDSRAVRIPHFAPRAKNVIFLFMAGAPSHIDLYDPKPELNRLHGQSVPASFLNTLDDALIKTSARCFGSPRSFSKFGQCGMEFSDYQPHMANCADQLLMVRSMWTSSSNHDPGQLLMQCGTPLFGHPCMGSWVTYGLGSESQNLPGFVVLLSNSGEGVDGGTALWSNGFLPSTYRGVTFRSQGDPILHLSNPEGITTSMQRKRIDAIRSLNQSRFDETGDPEITSRMEAYELAFRMQMAGPDLIDFSQETAATQDLYGLNDEKTRWFGSNCLLARRMVERGVRFVQLYHSTWDHHGNLNQRLKVDCGMTDRGTAALIQDLDQRGLLDDTLVIWGGEFGRTPMNEVRRGINPGSEGRDHHPFGFTMLFAGGGMKRGHI